MDFSWIAVLLLSFAWTVAVPVYEPPSLAWLLPAAVAVAFAFAVFCGRDGRGRAEALKNALAYCGLVTAAQGALFPFYCVWAARQHTESVFVALAGAVLRPFGARTVVEGNLLYVDAPLKTMTFSSAPEKLGAMFLLLFIAGGVVALLLKKARVKHFAAFFAVAFFYTVLRYAFLIMLYSVYALHSIFWDRVFTFVTFIPLALILAAMFKGLPAPTARISFAKPARSKAILTGGLAFLLVFAGVAFFGFRDPGKEKPGRVLVDEYHSDWEWTTDVYNEQWFGERSGYNYYCFFNYLDKFYETRRNMRAIDDETLKDTDVFIVKTPTKPFEAEEIALLTAYVEDGGGLYLIGDHTNVFGTGANLNQISKAFGLTFNYDCTYELRHGSLSEYDAPPLMPHPVVSDLPHFLFATSNTLGAKWQAEEIIVGYGLKGLGADYSQKNFFPADTEAPTMEFGLFLQSAGVGYGKGRVLAFTDSTVFSNFWMFMPGKPELLLGSVAWLNRENSLVGVTPRGIATAFLVVLLLLNLLWGFKAGAAFPLGIFVFAGLAAFVIGAGLFHIAAWASARAPEPIKPMTEIRFEREYSKYKLPNDLDGFMSAADEQLNTFYVWTQRLDYFPRAEEELLDAVRNGDLAILAKPVREIKNPRRILDELTAGARLLVLDNVASGAHSNGLLALAGMELTDARIGRYADYGEIRDIPLTANASAITGGEVLIRDEAGNAVCATARIGEGLLAVFSDPDLFYNRELGDVSANLTDKTKLLTDTEFKLLRALVESRPDGE
ncbi:MAG: hypothetical protein LBD95_01070 [Clostridiales Family XIII bacterium]|jgi:hypothetical protein|nr:hypothetical protein [Clostridiales Family XIII bacterium]